MINAMKMTVAAFAVIVPALSFGATAAYAVTCDGSWQTMGHRYNTQMQCYYLPTMSNGRITGLELERNVRNRPATPGAVIGGVVPHGGYYPPSGGHRGR